MKIDFDALCALLDHWKNAPPEHATTLLRILRTKRIWDEVDEIRSVPDLYGEHGDEMLADVIHEYFIEGYGLDDGWFYFFFAWIMEKSLQKLPITHGQYWNRRKRWSVINTHKIRRINEKTIEINQQGDITDRDLALIKSFANGERNHVSRPARGADPICSELNLLILIAKLQGMQKTDEIRDFVKCQFVARQERIMGRRVYASDFDSLSDEAIAKRINRFDIFFPELLRTDALEAVMS